MIWRPRDNRATPGPAGLMGTVGGGQFEVLVLEAARTCFERRSTVMESFVLGADADQCCGGRMDVLLEYHGYSAKLVLFGAGHVSLALVEVLAWAGLDIVVVDDREEWNSSARYGTARRLMTWSSGVAEAQRDPERTLACVMTYSHETDFELLRQLLDSPPVFVGLIGSRSKRVCLFSRLVASGVDEQVVQRVHCPIGVGDTGKEPKAVAISMAAQLLLEAKKLASA